MSPKQFHVPRAATDVQRENRDQAKRTIVAGSRDGVSHHDIALALAACPWPISVGLSGAARGADRMAEGLLSWLGIPVERYPADWSEYPKRRDGGYRRNLAMADQAEALIAIWDGQSRGTQHMIELATAKGLDVRVHTPLPRSTPLKEFGSMATCYLCGRASFKRTLFTGLIDGRQHGAHANCHAAILDGAAICQLPPEQRAQLTEQAVGQPLFLRLCVLAWSEGTAANEDASAPDFRPSSATIALTLESLEAKFAEYEHISPSALAQILWPGLPQDLLPAHQNALQRIATAMYEADLIEASYSLEAEAGWRLIPQAASGPLRPAPVTAEPTRLASHQATHIPPTLRQPRHAQL